jgi:methionyl aminopeptidase
MMTRIKSAEEVTAMRISGKMLASVLQHLVPFVQPDISTLELAEEAASELKKLGGLPAFLGYQGFPHVLCTSVNDTVVHGIPHKKTLLQAGDLVGLDFGVSYKEMITDAAITLLVGKGDSQLQDLLETTEAALQAGIFTAIDRVRTGDIGAAIQAVVDPKGYGIVRDLVGHGVGHRVHEEPNIPNFGNKGTGKQLYAGMTIAIEPMVGLGSHEVYIDVDGWAVRMRDGKKSAHFEHTVLITEDDAEILTKL